MGSTAKEIISQMVLHRIYVGFPQSYESKDIFEFQIEPIFPPSKISLCSSQHTGTPRFRLDPACRILQIFYETLTEVHLTSMFLVLETLYLHTCAWLADPCSDAITLINSSNGIFWKLAENRFVAIRSFTSQHYKNKSPWRDLICKPSGDAAVSI